MQLARLLSQKFGLTSRSSRPLPALRPTHPFASLMLALGLTLGVASVSLAQSGSQFVMLPDYRVGPYGNNGLALYGGMIDYMTYVNMKGGVNGVQLSWEECETEYNNARGVECYERLKTKDPVTKGTVVMPLSTGISYALVDKTAADKIPMVMIGYGLTSAIDGRLFPYAFPMVTTYQMQATAMIQFIAEKLGGKTPADLKGKKIAYVYHDSAFGKEPIPVLRAEAALNKFDVVEIPVAHPGTEQSAQWLRVRQERPDWVIFWGWGIMNPTGLQQAAKIGYPMDRILGVWWSGSEEDASPVGDAAKGYYAVTFGALGRDLPVVKDILGTVYAANKGNMADKGRVGTVLYTRGIIHGIITVEAMKVAQAKYGKRVMSAEEMRWGFENLALDQAKLKTLGAEGIMADLKITCTDHEGAGKVAFQQWDGKGWKLLPGGFKEGNRKLVRQLLIADGEKLAKEKGITPRTDCK